MLAKVLIDNISDKKYCSEWGLSIHIEYEGKNILLDTGSSDKFKRNAKALGIDLEKVDYGVLSHAHYDHSDGMGYFFDLNSRAKFYLSSLCEENCYGKRWIFSKYIGIRKGLMEKYKNRIIFTDGFTEITKGVYLVPHSTPDLDLIAKKAGLFIRKNKKLVPDDFSHEQSLVFETQKGLVIFNSCSHGSADNIIKEIAKAFPDKHIYALIGGFHLYRSYDSEVNALARRIKETGIEKIYTGHCTGDRAFEILKKELGEKAVQLRVGLEIEI